MEDLASAGHVNEALRQVRELKRRIADSEPFRGYSGRVRAVGGTVALLAAAVMSHPAYPRTVRAHLIGWTAVMAIALAANYSALLYWFLFHPDAKRDVQRLMPTVDALPPLAVGGVLTALLFIRGDYTLMFGTWMCMYGLANLSSRRVLSRAIWPVGMYYVICGSVCLFLPPAVTNPWPMALVFFVGEWAGGIAFYRNQVPDAPMSSFFLKTRTRP